MMIRSQFCAALPLLLGLAACDRTHADLPSTTGPIPLSDSSGIRIKLSLEPGGLDIVGATRTVIVSTVLAGSTLDGRQVEIETTNPSVAIVSRTSENSRWQLHQLSVGATELRARVDGGPYAELLVRVAPTPAVSNALVVERFSLHVFEDPYEPAGTVSYMPQVTLREPTGVSKATLVAASFSMPSAPSGFCQVTREWAPGSSNEAFGLDRYFGEPEISFGWYAPSESVGPVTVTLLVKDAQGNLGRIVLSKTMQRADFTSAPLKVQESHLSCS